MRPADPTTQKTSASRPAANVMPSSWRAFECGGVDVADHEHGREHGLPGQTGDDALDAADRALAVVAALHEQRVGQPAGLLEQHVVDAFEEVLQRAAHVPEVLGRAEQDAVAPTHVVGVGVERGPDAHVDPVDVVTGRARDRPRRRAPASRPCGSGRRQGDVGRRPRSRRGHYFRRCSWNAARSNARCSRTSPT